MFGLFLGFVSGLYFCRFWGRFGSHSASFLVVILATFLHFAKKARPYESAVNRSRIEGASPRKITKKLPKIQRKSGRNTTTKQKSLLIQFYLYLATHLEPFSESKCMQRSATNSTVFFIKKGDDFSWEREPKGSPRGPQNQGFREAFGTRPPKTSPEGGKWTQSDQVYLKMQPKLDPQWQNLLTHVAKMQRTCVPHLVNIW